MTQSDMFNSKASRFDSLEDVIEALKRMKDDPLADAGTNVVISRGNPEAKLLIIGEAPGPEENVKGKPFVGRAGQMLDKVLQSADFDPEKDVYITNSVFRMPPGDDGKPFRKPTTEEITTRKPSPPSALAGACATADQGTSSAPGRVTSAAIATPQKVTARLPRLCVRLPPAT